MKLEITRQTDDGDLIEYVDIDLDPQKFTMRELVRLEEMIGPQATEELMGGEIHPTPKLFQAMIFAKLTKTHPELTADQVDLDMSELEAWAAEVGPITLPMDADGVESVAEVKQDQGKA